MVPPIARPEALPPYVDDAGSIPNEENRKANRQLVAVPRELAAIVAAGSEGAPGAAACAVENLDAWAQANALLTRGNNFASTRQLLRYSTGLNMGVFRLRGRGVSLRPETLAWLESLAIFAAEQFEGRYDKHQIVDNLYVWSGVTAASFSLVASSPSLKAYADGVWRRAIDAIEPLGGVAAERRRGRRALSYHTYYLSAVLWLANIRKKQGHPVSPDDQNAIQSLEDFIVKQVCSSSRTLPGVAAQQIRPTASDYKSAFYLADEVFRMRIQECGLKKPPDYDAFLGGKIESLN
ncbi:alginate lyase family protein [Reyranella sp.]|uniref:alginate lyase family protein n=1 Tax=Reyranella sp. TaxID=1929291 RepID=UPI003D0AE3C5